MWTLNEGLDLVRALQPKTREFGFHLTLGGSVLNKGESDKDIDLYFLPMDNGKPSNANSLIDWLAQLWGTGEPIGGDYGIFENIPFKDPGSSWRTINATDTKTSGIWSSPIRYTKVQKTPTYKFKLKYIRNQTDRIDVFVVE